MPQRASEPQPRALTRPLPLLREEITSVACYLWNGHLFFGVFVIFVINQVDLVVEYTVDLFFCFYSDA